MCSHSSFLFDTGQSLLVDFDLCAPTRLVFFDIGLSLLMNFGMCSPTRLFFLTLVSCCWWTLTCALPLVLSFSHWSVAVGGLWLASCLFHTGHSLLVDFGLCASTRLVFFTLICRCWWSLACALPFVLSFLTLVSRCWWTLACALPLVLSFLTLVSRCWWNLA